MKINQRWLIFFEGRTDMLHILMEMYDRCKSYKGCQVDILGDFIFYAKQKEISTEQLSTQRLGEETLEEYANAYTEVSEILRYISVEDYNKIPKTKIELFETNANNNDSFTYFYFI